MAEKRTQKPAAPSEGGKSRLKKPAAGGTAVGKAAASRRPAASSGERSVSKPPSGAGRDERVRSRA